MSEVPKHTSDNEGESFDSKYVLFDPNDDQSFQSRWKKRFVRSLSNSARPNMYFYSSTYNASSTTTSPSITTSPCASIQATQKWKSRWVAYQFSREKSIYRGFSGQMLCVKGNTLIFPLVQITEPHLPYIPSWVREFYTTYEDLVTQETKKALLSGK